MNHKLFFALMSIAALFTALLFNSCKSDNSVAPLQKITVTGTVKTHLNSYVSNVSVIIGDKTAITNAEGKFVISDITAPYDVYLFDTINNKNSLQKTGIVFKNLSIENPQLIFAANTQSNSGTINVIFKDGIASNKKAAMFFTNGSDINAHGISNFNDSIAYIPVFLPDTKSVKGRLIAMLYSIDQNQQIVSYDNFGFKDDVQISANNYPNESFRADEMTYNPPEANVSGSIAGVPANSSLSPFYFYLSFSGKAPVAYATFLTMSNFTGQTFDVKVPAQLPINYYPVIGAFVLNGSQYNIGKSNFILPVTNQTGLQYNLISGASLLSPPNSSSGFNPKDNLQWNCSQTENIFCIKIQYAEGNRIIDYFVYTNSLNYNLYDISKFNFQPLYGKVFNWSVDVLGNFNSVDDLVNPSFLNISRSDCYMPNKWSFTTSPVK